MDLAFLIVDSGATISALPKSDAVYLGIQVTRGHPTVITAIGGHRLSGWRHEIHVRFGEELVRLPVVILNSDEVPRVLGRAGIFERFTIMFEEKRQRTGFLAEGRPETASVRKILDQLL